MLTTGCLVIISTDLTKLRLEMEINFISECIALVKQNVTTHRFRRHVERAKTQREPKQLSMYFSLFFSYKERKPSIKTCDNVPYVCRLCT